MAASSPKRPRCPRADLCSIHPSVWAPTDTRGSATSQLLRNPFASGHLVGTNVLVREVLDVHVVDRHNLHPADEPGRPVHVPHPGVGELDLEPGTAGPFVLGNVDMVGEIEPAFGLDRVGEHGEDIAVLLPQPEFQVVLVAFDVFFAHGSSSRCRTGPGPPRAYSRS